MPGRLTLITIMMVVVLSGCYKAPELPYEPKIYFEYVQFKEADGPDSLIVSIYFEDGNGDLGLSPNEIDEPYHPYDIVKDNNGDTIKYGSQEGLPEYNPIDWKIIRDSQGRALDTILIEINENYNNYFVRFYQKKNGDYLEFDWRDAPYYQTFDGRFPILKSGDDNDRPLEGSLRYAMLSSGWLIVPAFRDTIKLSIQIQDRALNKSNIVESQDFTLESVRIEQE